MTVRSDIVSGVLASVVPRMSLVLLAVLSSTLASTPVPPYYKRHFHSSPCGCVELNAMNPQMVTAWTVFPNYQPEVVQYKCDHFCQDSHHFSVSKWSSSRYPSGRVMCKCYKQLEVFDCDEEVGAALVEVHCKQQDQQRIIFGETAEGSNHVLPHMDVMAAINGFVRGPESASKEPRNHDKRAGLDNLERRGHAIDLNGMLPFHGSNQDSNDIITTDDDSSVTGLPSDAESHKELGLTALILGSLAFICIGVLAIITWYGHRRKKNETTDSSGKICQVEKGNNDDNKKTSKL